MALKKPCIVASKIFDGETFIFVTFFCGKRDRCWKKLDDKETYAELPDDAAEKARNANACDKCVSAIEKVVCSKMEITTKVMV